MRYAITGINRTVELSDELANEYRKYDELREQPFRIVIRSRFGHAPSRDEVSDEELSVICNEVLLHELKALALLPKAVTVVKQLAEHAEKGEQAEIQL
jgi:hypothetical protein